MSESESVTKDQILAELRKIDEEKNDFQFSKCRSRYIVVRGSKSAARHILGNAVRRDRIDKVDYARKTKTFLMVPDDPTCNICVINLVELQPFEEYEPPPEKKSPTRPSPTSNINRAIYHYATKIHLIFFICNQNDQPTLQKMIRWAKEDPQRQAIMALVLLHQPSENTVEEKSSAEQNLEVCFPKGIIHIDMRAYRNGTGNDWQNQFFRLCVGEQDDTPFTITPPVTNQPKTSNCNLA